MRGGVELLINSIMERGGSVCEGVYKTRIQKKKISGTLKKEKIFVYV